ncbi:hypothetical protein BC830DRAFT_528783 [Chytriomyces sp. MP71]|nr:hypothetical protein BC830DRAFT_528783 [Chytriomyces sp. MP71]
MKGATGGAVNGRTVYGGPPSSSGRKKRSQASELKMAVVTAAADALRLERMQSGTGPEEDDDDEKPMATPVLARGAMSAVLVGTAEKLFPMIPLATQMVAPAAGSRKGGVKRKAGKANMDLNRREGSADSVGADAIDTADDDDKTPLPPKKKAKAAPRKRKTKATIPVASKIIDAPMTLSTDISMAPSAIEPAPLSGIAKQARLRDLPPFLPPPLVGLTVGVAKEISAYPTASEIAQCDMVPSVSALNDITADTADASNEGTFSRITKFSCESTCVDTFLQEPKMEARDPCLTAEQLDVVMKIVDQKPDILIVDALPLSLMEPRAGLQQVDHDITFAYVDIQDDDAGGNVDCDEPSYFNPEPSQPALDASLNMDWDCYFSVAESLELMQDHTSLGMDRLGTAFLSDGLVESAPEASDTYMDPTMDGFFDLQMYDDNLMRSNSGPSHSLGSTSSSLTAISDNFQQQPLAGFLFRDTEPSPLPLAIAMRDFSSTTETIMPIDAPASSSKPEPIKFSCTVPGCSKVYASQYSLSTSIATITRWPVNKV